MVRVEKTPTLGGGVSGRSWRDCKRWAGERKEGMEMERERGGRILIGVLELCAHGHDCGCGVCSEFCL